MLSDSMPFSETNLKMEAVVLARNTGVFNHVGKIVFIR